MAGIHGPELTAELSLDGFWVVSARAAYSVRFDSIPTVDGKKPA